MIFQLDFIMTTPSKNSLMAQLNFPDSSDQIYISAPDSASLENLFGLDYTFEFKQDDRVYYTSFWTPAG